jgi:hypothetical protein
MTYSKYASGVTYILIIENISLTECSIGTTQKLPFGVNTTVEFKRVTATSDNTYALLKTKHTPPDAVFVGCGFCMSAFVVLTPNGNFCIVSLLHSVTY